MKFVLLAALLLTASPLEASEPESEKANCQQIIASAKTTSSGEFLPWRSQAIFVHSELIAGIPIAAPRPEDEVISSELLPDLPEPVTPEVLAVKYLQPELGHFEKQSLTVPIEARDIWDASADTQSALVIGEDGKKLFFLNWQTGAVKKLKAKLNRTFFDLPCNVGTVYSLAPGDFFVSAFRPGCEDSRSASRFIATQRTDRKVEGFMVADLAKYSTVLIQNKTKPYFYNFGEGASHLGEILIGKNEVAYHQLFAPAEFHKVDWKDVHLVPVPAAKRLHLISKDFSTQATIRLTDHRVCLSKTQLAAASSQTVKVGQSQNGDWLFGMDYAGLSPTILAANTVDPSKSWTTRIRAESRIHQALVVDDGKLALLATEKNGIVLYDLVHNVALRDRLWDSPPEVLRIRQTENGTILYWGPVAGRVPGTFFVHLSPVEIRVPTSLNLEAAARKIEGRADLHAETISVSQELSRIVASIKKPGDGSTTPISTLENLRDPLVSLHQATRDLWSLRERNLALHAAVGSELQETLAQQQIELRELGTLDPKEPRASALKLSSRLRYNEIGSLEENSKLSATMASAIDDLIVTSSDGARTLENLQRELSTSVDEAGRESIETQILDALNKVRKDIDEAKR